MKSLDDTIGAIATPPGEGGISIVRISGPDTVKVGTVLLRDRDGGPAKLRPRYAHFCIAVDGEGAMLDEVIALHMPGPNSYTREDVLEIQCHGGRAAANAILDAALAGGVRLADPGEFTLRALLHGRLDLVQAESVADIIHAQTGEALKVHERLLEGRLSAEVARWQDELAGVLALLEAHLDFPEDDLPDVDKDKMTGPLREVLEQMDAKLDSHAWGRTASEGFKVAIIGSPNVGKSSLLNLMAEEERAIVSSTAGTTRDTIEIPVNACGAPVRLIDTAGLRVSADEIEQEGVARARRAAEVADMVMLIFDGSRAPTAEEVAEAETLASSSKPVLGVVNKTDLGEEGCGVLERLLGAPPVLVSAKICVGIDTLLLRIRERAWSGKGPGNEAALTRLRHRNSVATARESVQRALALLETGEYLDAAGSELHRARASLGELLGYGTPEDVLDKIFSDFCIGK